MCLCSEMHHGKCFSLGLRSRKHKSQQDRCYLLLSSCHVYFPVALISFREIRIHHGGEAWWQEQKAKKLYLSHKHEAEKGNETG